jgi:hypothetical protein
MKKIIIVVAIVLMLAIPVFAEQVHVQKATINGHVIYIGQMQSEMLKSLGDPNASQEGFVNGQYQYFYEPNFIILTKDGLVVDIIINN